MLYLRWRALVPWSPTWTLRIQAAEPQELLELASELDLPEARVLRPNPELSWVELVLNAVGFHL